MINFIPDKIELIPSSSKQEKDRHCMDAEEHHLQWQCNSFEIYGMSTKAHISIKHNIENIQEDMGKITLITRHSGQV